MPVYHFTIHAYRSWGPDHPRGYAKKGEGYLPTDREMAQHYDGRANFSKVRFERQVQEILILGSYDLCTRRGWRLHAVGTDPTHFHAVISWSGFLEWEEVRRVLKNILSLLLGRTLEQPGRKWFVRDGSRKRVTDADHLKHRKEKYLPDHPGVFWREGLALPEDRYGILGS